MRLSAVVLLLLSAPAVAVTCDQSAATAPLPIRTTLVAPFSAELSGAPLTQGASGGLLVAPRDESLAVDVVLQRLRASACAALASTSTDGFDGYQKKTAFDNTPWRYESKPGERFSAEEFDAWMKSRGVRVAKGRAADAAQPVGEKVGE
jgi:hypothetical protein